MSFAVNFQTEYGAHIVGSRQVGGLPIDIFRFDQPAGSFPDPPTDDFVISYAIPALGTCRAEFDFGAGRWRGIHRPRMVAVAPPQVDAHYAADDAGKGTVISIPRQTAMALVPDHSPCAAGDLGAVHSAPFEDAMVVTILDSIWTHASHADQRSALFIESAIATLLTWLSCPRNTPAAWNTGGLAPWQVRRSVEQLRPDLAASVSLADLAAGVGLSPFHFARAFRKSVGTPPHRYLMQLRIERACALLAHTEMSVTEIALEVGYESSQSLARAFGAEMGVNPSRWRRDRRA